MDLLKRESLLIAGHPSQQVRGVLPSRVELHVGAAVRRARDHPLVAQDLLVHLQVMAHGFAGPKVGQAAAVNDNLEEGIGDVQPLAPSDLAEQGAFIGAEAFRAVGIDQQPGVDRATRRDHDGGIVVLPHAPSKVGVGRLAHLVLGITAARELTQLGIEVPTAVVDGVELGP